MGINEVATKFYTVNQNNSGGYIFENETVGQFVIIEAKNAEDAEERLQSITADYSEYCSCCGERWSAWWDDSEGKEGPMIYGEQVDKFYDSFWRNTYAIIHYLDGSIRRVDIKEESE